MARAASASAGVDAAAARAIALALPFANERDHHGRPSFRVAGKIFATLWAAERRAMVKLGRSEQAAALALAPETFAPAPGGWGHSGWTRVQLDRVSAEELRQMLRSAWELAAPRDLRRLATLIDDSYAAFNARDIDAALAAMAPNVRWANGMAGGFVHGRAAVREYWSHQWQQIDPRVAPGRLTLADDGSVAVTVEQTVHDRSGALLHTSTVTHRYTIARWRIQSMTIERPEI